MSPTPGSLGDIASERNKKGEFSAFSAFNVSP